MQAKEVFWHYFQATGSIGSYLLSNHLVFHVHLYDDALFDEEQFEFE